MELKNKVVVITGGTKGIGKALALSFLNEGSEVVVCSKDENEIKEISNDKILGIYADVTKEKDLQNLLQNVIEKFNHIDIWINNAGIWVPHLPIEETDWGKAHDLMEVNFFGVVFGSKTALVQMRKQGFGIIINILSTRALKGEVGCSAYSASKFAAKGFTDVLRAEVKDSDIKVISIYPEKIKTNLFFNKIPVDYDKYMEATDVSNKIIDNLKNIKIEEELIIKREN